MKEAEKEAERIIEMYKDIITEGGTIDVVDRDYKAKQCALIHVNGIIDVCKEYIPDLKFSQRISYWQEVKQIIENK